MAIHMPLSLTSSLNPDAPLFIPSTHRLLLSGDDAETHDDYFFAAAAAADDDGDDDGFSPDWDSVEDFSPEWWNLVHISPHFCQYWLRNYEDDASAAAVAEDWSLQEDGDGTAVEPVDADADPDANQVADAAVNL